MKRSHIVFSVLSDVNNVFSDFHNTCDSISSEKTYMVNNYSLVFFRPFFVLQFSFDKDSNNISQPNLSYLCHINVRSHRFATLFISDV
jgi:hypothetical protein